MKLLILTLTFLCMHPVYAVTWSRVGGAGAQTMYLDQDNFTRDGDIVGYWLLHDFSKPLLQNSRVTKSAKIHYSGNCSNNTGGTGVEVYYSESMGKGEVVSTNQRKAEFYPQMPKSVGENVLSLVCTVYTKKPVQPPQTGIVNI